MPVATGHIGSQDSVNFLYSKEVFELSVSILLCLVSRAYTSGPSVEHYASQLDIDGHNWII